MATLFGTEFSYLEDSLSIRQRLGSCDSCSFDLMLTPGASIPVVVGQPIQIAVGEDPGATLLWGGTVDRYREIEQVTGKRTQGTADSYTRRLRVECVCYTQLAERFYVAETYSSQPAGQIAADLVQTYLDVDGVTTDGVVDGPTVEEAQFPYIRLSEALNDLAELTGYHWFIGPNKDLTFAPRTANTAPIEITDTNKPYFSLTIERGRSEYRNKQIIRAGEDLTSERTETFVGDGERKVFNVAFPVGKKPAVKVNGTTQTVGIRGLDDGEDWFWNKGRTEISQADGASALAGTDTLSVTYQGLFPIVVQARDVGEIESRQQVEGGSGVYEAIESAPQINDSAAALEKAEGMLARYAEIGETLTFSMDEPRLRKGQLLTVELTAQGLSDTYLIDAVNWRAKGDNELRAQVTAISGDSVGGWTRYFREQQEARREFIIRENEVVVLQRRVTDEVAVADTPDATSQAFEPLKIGNSDGIGFSSIGDVTHEALLVSESVTVSDTPTITTNADEGFRIGTDGIGFASIGFP
jgi:hypothetical protein